MASMAVSRMYYSRIVISAKIIFILAAIAIMAAFAFSTVDYKFNKLEYLRSSWSTSVPIAQIEKELECLAKNIYWEAASESFEGKVAVAQVTMNRVNSKKFGNSVCGVVFQKNVIYEKIVCQFSWVCEGNYKIREVNKKHFEESREVAKKVFLENFSLPSLRDALYYHATYVNPGWKKEKIATIGQHVFYK